MLTALEDRFARLMFSNFLYGQASGRTARPA